VSKGDYVANLYSYYFAKMTIDRKVCPNTYKESSHKHNAQTSMYRVNAQENHTLSTQRNIQRKYSGGTKEECHSYMSMHKRTNAQENHTECTKKIQWRYKGTNAIQIV